MYIPTKKDGRGRIRTAFVCDENPIQLKEIIKQIPDEQWEEIAHRKGTKGYLVRKSVMLDVYIWKPERKNNIESVQLIISTETDGSEIKYSLCYSSEGKMPLKTALYRQMQRYWIERAFQNVKEQLGLLQYQVCSWRAWHHHIDGITLHFTNSTRK